MNAQYDALLNKMTVKSNNVNAIKELYLTCSPEMKEGKTYNIQDISCTLLTVDLFAGWKSSVGKTSDMTIKFEGKKMTLTSNSFIGELNKSSSFWGCFQVWSLILLIVVVIVVIVLIVFLSMKCCCKNKLPKKSKK